MNTSTLLIIIFQFFLSYFFFKLFLNSNFGLKPIDDFSFFKRTIRVKTGSGINFLFIFIIIITLFYYYENFSLNFPKNFYIFFIALSILTLLGYLDDKFDIDPIVRLVVQVISIYVSLSTVPHTLSFLPIKMSIFIAVIMWVYIMNITNFVDGADGYCVIICICFFINIFFITTYLNINLFSNTIALINIPLLLIFLIFFNFPPAKLFMGDAGSIFLGFLIGYSILELSFNGFYFLALSSFAYPFVDCTITLIKKTLKGNLPWARLGDYYFLIYKKKSALTRNTTNNEKKLFLSILFYSLGNNLIIFLSVVLNSHYISLINFLLAILLIKFYAKFKNVSLRKS